MSSNTTTLATSAPHRLLAWPRYDQTADLDSLARHFGPLLVGRTDVCLCLRHDLTRDVPLADAVRAVEAAFARAHGRAAVTAERRPAGAVGDRSDARSPLVPDPRAGEPGRADLPRFRSPGRQRRRL